MIEQFTREDFENFLDTDHAPIEPLGLVDGEYTYKLPLDNQTSIVVRSSVKSSGLSADVGKDSIRCWLVSGDRPLGSKVSKWTTRQPGWGDRLNENIKQLTLWRTLAGDCKECDQPKGVFKAKTEANKGRPFTKCQDHGGFAWLDEPVKTSDIYFSEESRGKDSNSGEDGEQVACPDSTTGDNRKQLSKGVLWQDSEIDLSQDGNSDPVARDNRALQKLPEKTPNFQQRQAIEADINANLRVLASPGSGKTFIIEHRYKFLVDNGVNPDQIVVCTFGKQSATDMGQRIQKTCPSANLEQICTINALCYRLLAKWYTNSRWYKWRGPKDWRIKKCLEDIIGPIWQEEEKPSAQEVYGFINTSKYLGLTTDDSYLWFVDALGDRRGAWLYEIRSKFDAWLNRSKFLTFADQLFLVEQQLKNNTAWRNMVQERFSVFIVDEMQDTSGQAIRILVTISLEPRQNTVYESENE